MYSTQSSHEAMKMYVEAMEHDRTPLDHVMLQTVCELARIKITVFDADGIRHTLTPYQLQQTSMTELYLGHLGHNEFMHFTSSKCYGFAYVKIVI